MQLTKISGIFTTSFDLSQKHQNSAARKTCGCLLDVVIALLLATIAPKTTQNLSPSLWKPQGSAA